MTSVTRGTGLLEKSLAGLRAKKADQMIPAHLREGRLLDIGCGHRPLFLEQTEFAVKVGIEQSPPASPLSPGGLFMVVHDIGRHGHLPFDDGAFDVVTMLAVFEHLEPQRIVDVLDEIYRVLTPRGLFFFTTPPPWTDKLLQLMAKVHLVSPVEIEEHKKAYTQAEITRLLQKSRFVEADVAQGYFEARMNIWCLAEKQANSSQMTGSTQSRDAS